MTIADKQHQQQQQRQQQQQQPDDDDNEENVPILGYWNIRGNAQPIRLLLHYTKTRYKEKKYNFGKCDQDKIIWRSSKFNLELDFPNLPYYIEGNLKLTQSLTILRYLAKKHNLAGQTEKERTRIDLLEQQLRDYRNEFIEASTNKNFEKARLIYLARLPEKLRALSSFLKERPFFCGNSLSYVDFMAYEYIDQHHYLSHELFEQYGCQNLVEYLQRIEALPTIKEYQYSQDYIRHPSGLLVAWYEAKFFSTFNRSVSDKPTEQLKQEIEDTNSSSDVEQDMYLV
ncbi:Glutathione S-transferase Mu 4 [Dermatophagoides farinae]|uniref:glutathione transferase n=1 Tax=Dermatophagoides farinae TaxID=6954 RepID=A0A922I2C7_DERFA|nr:Glutathione S-transferase Mu 4 [Dermatophagoides farinae]